MAAATGASAGISPFGLYGDAIEFDVIRKGTPVGSHRVQFVGRPDDLRVISQFNLKIDFLFFTAYAYDYRSDARWRNGKLEALTSSVDDNGDLFSLAAERVSNRMIVKRGDVTDNIDAPVYPTNHWNAGVLAQSRVLNTLTGRENRVAITAQGREQVETERGPVAATRYAYSGDLQNEVWYDDAGRWVKMRFKGSDGSTIEYRCRRCQGPGAPGAGQ